MPTRCAWLETNVTWSSSWAWTNVLDQSSGSAPLVESVLAPDPAGPASEAWAQVSPPPTPESSPSGGGAMAQATYQCWIAGSGCTVAEQTKAKLPASSGPAAASQLLYHSPSFPGEPSG